MPFFASKSRISNLPKPPSESLLKRVRILVIDDVSTEFPFGILQDHGYSIDYWPDVKELRKLETGFYDIIILDIGGVATEFDQRNEGAGLLSHIKRVNPSQIIIAYSGQSHESERIPFFQAADQYIPKPASVLVWKETLDETIRDNITVDHYWSSMKQVLQAQGCDDRSIRKIERVVVSAASAGGGGIDTIRATIGRYVATPEGIGTCITIAGQIIKIVHDFT